LTPYKPLVYIEVSLKESEKLVKLLEDNNGYMAMCSAEPQEGEYWVIDIIVIFPERSIIFTIYD